MWEIFKATFLVSLATLLIEFSIQSPVFKVEMLEHKISDNNDTVYVRQIMRLAKSAEMKNYMNEEVDACDNFFTYACGNWAKINPASGILPRETNFFELLSETYNNKQLRVLQEEQQKDDTDIVRMVKNFYASCINLKDFGKERYKQRLKDIIEEFGKMPALLPIGVWDENEFDWLNTIGKIQKRYGIDIILLIGVRHDFENKTINKIFVGQPVLKLQTKSMYLSDETKWHREFYKKEIQDKLEKYLGIDEERATTTASDIVDFEIQLAKGMIEKKLVSSLKSATKLRSLDEMQDIYAPVIDFKKFLYTALGFELNATFYEFFLDYQVNLKGIIQKTPNEKIANYIMYQLVQNFFFDYDETLNNREHMCLGKTKRFFAKVLDNIIFHKYNDKQTEQDIDLIWQKLKEIFKDELQSNRVEWMTLMTKKLAIEKLEHMNLEINSHQNNNFSEEFSNLNISSRDFVENQKEYLSFNSKRAIESLSSSPKPSDHIMLSYSPAYIASENLIKIPVSLLQPNFLWSDHYPNALKFGTLGYLIAHEMIHGFDDMGRNFDALGHEKNWWDSNSTEAFNDHKMCFKHQYARYRYGGKYLPESELQAENIADNGAVQLAYAAYLQWLNTIPNVKPMNSIYKDNINLENLPNIHFTSKQLFFLSFAQFWCNDVNERLKDKVSLIDLHSPAMFRVIGPLANFEEFSKEFHCIRGSQMNPQRKCKIY